MEKAVVRTTEIYKIISLPLGVVGLGLMALSSFIFIQRRKSYRYGIKYRCDATANLLSTVISLTDLIRQHVENMSHYILV